MKTKAKNEMKFKKQTAQDVEVASILKNPNWEKTGNCNLETGPGT